MANSARRVLVVDGNGQDRALISQMLSRCECEVQEAACWADALEKIKALPPDLILLGKLPGLDAPALAEWIKSNRPPSRILIAIDDVDLGRFNPLRAGADDFLVKPIRAQELLARVHWLLRAGRPEAASAERTDMLERALRGQRELLAQAQQARQLWESTFNAMTDAVVITDLSGKIRLSNNQALAVLNLTPAQLLDRSCDELLAEGSTCPHRSLSDGRIVSEVEALSRAGDRFLSVRASRFEDASGKPAGFVHVIGDITQRKIMERQLIQAERMSLAGQMVSAVAHEVATPLSVIANIAEMLMMDFEPGSRASAELSKIVKEARRVAEMMRRILNFVRQAPTSFREVDMAELARETLDLIAYELRKSKIEARLDVEPGLPPVWGDRAQLQQVLLNLITNAIQAMRSGGQLALGLSRDRANVLLTIEDTGPGIPAEAMSKLFDFFYTTKLAEGGTGLGLAISRQIIEGHGGQIAAENRASGGARFLIKLPAAAKAKAAEKPAPIVLTK
jgi:PAS domain S-box-containing protein